MNLLYIMMRKEDNGFGFWDDKLRPGFRVGLTRLFDILQRLIVLLGV